MTVSDYPDWQTPAAHAAQIAVQGVPLLRATNQLSSGAGSVLAGGATAQILNSVSINQPSYEVTIQSWMAAGSGTIPFLHLALLWWDSLTGLFGSRRDVVVPAGNAVGNVLTCYLHGPMHSDMFRVDGVNLDPAVAQNLTWMVNQTSHVFEHDESRQYAYAGTPPNGFVNPAGVPTTNMLVYEAPTIAASGAVTVLCALYSGDVILNIDNSSATASVTVNLLDAAGYSTAHANGSIFKTVVAASSEASIPLTLPHTPVELKISNTATVGSITPVITIIGQEH